MTNEGHDKIMGAVVAYVRAYADAAKHWHREPLTARAATEIANVIESAHAGTPADAANFAMRERALLRDLCERERVET